MFREGCFAAVLALAPCLGVTLAQAQAAPAASAQPKLRGTVKATGATGFTLTAASGDVVVTVPAGVKIIVVAPGAKTLAGAPEGSLSDVAQGDGVLVTGTAGDTGAATTATRVVLMKAGAIADAHAAEEAAWAQGGGGIVKSVDSASGTIVVASGLKTVTIQTGAATSVKRYSGDSVRFQDAVAATLADVHPGDQLRVRGTKSADGSSIQADAIVIGTFSHYSGLIAAIDATAGTITLKDLASKRTVTVAVTANSDVHRLPPMVAQRIAAGMKGGAGAAAQGAPGASAAHAGSGAPDASQQARRAGGDLSSMIARLPPETLSGLKPGEAVMIVASGSGPKSSAVTLLVGVDPILTAPSGDTMTISPWSIGGASGDAGGAGGGR